MTDQEIINSPTDRQLDFIKNIEDLTGVPFTGHTKKDATEYIEANIAEFRKKEWLEGEYQALTYENAGDRI